MILVGTDLFEINDMKNYLDYVFKIKGLGNLHYFLGLEVIMTSTSLHLNQRKYALKLLVDSGFLGEKIVRTTITQGSELNNATRAILLDHSTIHTTHSQTNILNHNWTQYVSHHIEVHLKATHKVLRYIKGALG